MIFKTEAAQQAYAEMMEDIQKFSDDADTLKRQKMSEMKALALETANNIDIKIKDILSIVFEHQRRYAAA